MADRAQGNYKQAEIATARPKGQRHWAAHDLANARKDGPGAGQEARPGVRVKLLPQDATQEGPHSRNATGLSDSRTVCSNYGLQGEFSLCNRQGERGYSRTDQRASGAYRGGLHQVQVSS